MQRPRRSTSTSLSASSPRSSFVSVLSLNTCTIYPHFSPCRLFCMLPNPFARFQSFVLVLFANHFFLLFAFHSLLYISHRILSFLSFSLSASCVRTRIKIRKTFRYSIVEGRSSLPLLSPFSFEYLLCQSYDKRSHPFSSSSQQPRVRRVLTNRTNNEIMLRILYFLWLAAQKSVWMVPEKVIERRGKKECGIRGGVVGR